MPIYTHRLCCQITLATPSAAGQKCNWAGKKSRPPPPIGAGGPQNLHYFPRIVPLSANSHWQAEGVAGMKKFLTYMRFSPLHIGKLLQRQHEGVGSFAAVALSFDRQIKLICQSQPRQGQPHALRFV